AVTTRTITTALTERYRHLILCEDCNNRCSICACPITSRALRAPDGRHYDVSCYRRRFGGLPFDVHAPHQYVEALSVPLPRRRRVTVGITSCYTDSTITFTVFHSIRTINNAYTLVLTKHGHVLVQNADVSPDTIWRLATTHFHTHADVSKLVALLPDPDKFQ